MNWIVCHHICAFMPGRLDILMHLIDTVKTNFHLQCVDTVCVSACVCVCVFAQHEVMPGLVALLCLPAMFHQKRPNPN